MQKKVIMICEECLGRNYKTSKNKYSQTRLELNKYCSNCNGKKLHKESR